MTSETVATENAKLSTVGWMIVAFGALTVLRGLVLRSLWAWFVVPTFHAPLLALSATIGLSTLAMLVLGSTAPQSKERSDRAAAEHFVRTLGVLLLLWAVGACAHWAQ